MIATRTTPMPRFPSLLLCLLPCLLLADRATAQELGRLFTTPAERQALDRGRHQARPGAPPAAARPGMPGWPAPSAGADAPATSATAGAAADGASRLPPPVAGERMLVVNGIVRRSGGGRATTWIDAVPHTGSGSVGGGVTLEPARQGGRVELRLGSGQSVTLKPGQTVDAVSGRVKEAYQPAAARRARPAPPEMAP